MAPPLRPGRPPLAYRDGRDGGLASLSSHAFEHPADTVPEFADEAPLLEAEAIGHPLLPEDRVVRNDIRIGGAHPAGPRVVIVSGSNMSGRAPCCGR